MTALTRPLAYGPVEYPDSDRRILGETDRHHAELMDLVFRLKGRYRDDPSVYVTGRMFVYYEEGDPRKVFSPDVMVVFGVPKHERRVYLLWEERQAPAVVFELSSRATWREDLVSKKALCARLGVEEYYLCDPAYEHLRPALQGFRLDDGTYVPLLPDEDGRLHSARLGLALSLEDGQIRMTDLVTGERLPGTAEMWARLAAAEQASARQRVELERGESSGEG